MNADRLLQHYERIADAPDAIARLRRFILDLAVRGKLVPQDPSDEPASELLKRIAKEKALLVKEGGFSSLEGSVELTKAEPFAIPASWAWCLLDDIAGIARGGSPRPIKSFLTEDPRGIPWIKIGDSTRGTIYIDTTEERIKPEGLSRSRLVVPGDLLLSNSMSFGYPYITNISGCIHDGWLVIRTPENHISKLYIHRMFLSEYAKQAFSIAAAGAVVQNLNADKVRRLQVPLPPLAEQRRIVAKVDELMDLCDRLEAARAGRERSRDRLAAASLARLNAPDPETFQDDARFALDALSALTTRPDQIKRLRQSILNLAVRGKLEPQDANDEPASELLKRIAKEKARLVKAGEIKKEKPLDPIMNQPFDLPLKWSWVRLDSLSRLITKGSSPKWQGVNYVNADEGILFITSENVGNQELRKLDELKYVESRFRDIEPRSMLRRGDILMNLVGASIGRTAIFDLDKEANINQAVALVRLVEISDGPLVQYLLQYFNSPTAIDFMLGSRVITAQPNMSLTDAREFPIPLPPLAEQHRIVAKVDALMALCDRLEASLDQTAAIRRRLLDALLAEALAPTKDLLLRAAE
ncbi:restriction endonuclease subunit S [Hyphomicrobium sp.]|uniref:restriction endonuclease subunit S n=1 Tax=Hyphomicrobium sp. TaxID=82 RepID=UPI000FB35395|nr:restriction endonuclease subunit S [Hyphomicrobium sp.]RUO97988.1 MAG: restriction endonuclease subunit S [Hyphomicrobium sp.]